MKRTPVIVLLLSLSTFIQAQSAFDDFKKRVNKQYIQWQAELGKGVNHLTEESPYTEKITLKEDNATVWAIVIGVSSYWNMQSLSYADDDAFKIHSFLKSPEGGALKDEQISLLIDDEATKENILTTVKNVVTKADSNDIIFFYFSGHGLEGAFLPVDYGKERWEKKKLVKSTADKVYHEELAHLFESSKAKSKICIADACHSGSLVAEKGAMNSLQSYYEALERTKGGLALFMSSKTDEISLEHKGVRQGVFSHYLIQGLSGEADVNEDQVVTIAELYDYVNNRVKSYTNNRQHPTISGAFDPLMPVGVVR